MLGVGSSSDPSSWDDSRHSAASRYLLVSGLKVRYSGPGGDDRDAAAVRANRPIRKLCPFYYWEAEIVNKGRDGFIGIGLLTVDVKLDRLPGV